MRGSLLVVAGEASGDRAAASVVARLRARMPREALRVFGMGGGALESEDVELVADLRDATALGVGEVARRAASIGLAYARVRHAAHRARPTAALLVNYTEFNVRLAPELWNRGTRVLFYGAPQVWAWRRQRGAKLRRHVDRMAVMLPFEEALWRELGIDAHYVGHPALEERSAALARASALGGGPEAEARLSAREMLGLTPRAWTVAVLPGSRPHEVRRLLAPMLAGYEAVRRDRASVDARVFVAPSLDEKTRAWAREVSAAYHVDVVDVPARAGLAAALPAFDVSLCASGTASLECALARAVPVVCYRVGLAAELGARALMTTPFVALPNVLLGRAAFPELLQRQATATRIADALARVLDGRRELLAACADVEASLGGKASASREVARMLEPWLLERPSEAPAAERSEAPKATSL